MERAIGWGLVEAAYHAARGWGREVLQDQGGKDGAMGW